MAQNLLDAIKDIFDQTHSTPRCWGLKKLNDEKWRRIMIATYPLYNDFFKVSGKKADPQQSQHKLKEDNNVGLDFGQAPLDAFGSPEGEADNYHLGRTIYML